MAFSKTPQTSTNQTKEVTLLNEWETRDASNTKDNLAVNCFYELIKNKQMGDKDFFVVKRDGTSTYPFLPPSANIRGFHYWEDQDKFFVCTDSNINVITASTGVLIITLAAVFGTTTGPVGYCEFLYDTNNTKVVLTDGTTLVTIDSANTVVTSVSADMPVPHLPYPVFLDGYLFLVKKDTADIYNSNLNDPLVWTPGDFITAEMTADNVILISNLNNYLIVFGSGSIEYFFDAANEAGSPLQKYDSPHKFVGYVSGFAKYENDILFLGNSATTGIQVFLASDLKIEPIGTPPIRRTLTVGTVTHAGVVAYGGHDFYVLTMDGETNQYDLKEKLWSKLAFQGTNAFALSKATVINKAGAGLVTIFSLDGDSKIYFFDPTKYQDNGINFSMIIVTDNETFDTYRNKTCARMLLLGDRAPVPAELIVSWTDDDYQSFSTPRPIDMSLNTPILSRLGQFRRRAWKLVWTQNLPMRLKKIELDLNMGQS